MALFGKGVRTGRAVAVATGLALAFALWPFQPASAATVPAAEIRISDASRVPACVTPERLTAFLRTRNDHLEPRFVEIARWYRHYGEAWRVRWDYAFFQMAVETNFLTFRRGDGSRGDVRPEQNNFAGIGTTGGGVPGDAFPDVKTGVLGHIQHLVAYSGERLAAPVAPRTRLKQDDIVSSSLRIGRPVRFSDLARRWAVDRRYGQSIEFVAETFRKAYCLHAAPAQVAAVTAPEPPKRDQHKREPHKPVPPKPELIHRPKALSGARQGLGGEGLGGEGLGGEPKPPPTPAAARNVAKKPAAAKPSPVRTVRRAAASPASVAVSQPATARPSQVAALVAAPTPANSATAPPAAGCSVASASYGGSKTLLIRAEAAGAVRYVTLGVLEGFEQSMADGYISRRAPGGTVLAAFESRAAALARARQLCPGG